MNIFRSFTIPGLVIILLQLSCSFRQSKISSDEAQALPQHHWFRQAIVDLGSRIRMFSTTEGLAISRGRGNDVKGKAYRYHNGQWIPFDEFEYSDFPLIARSGENKVWTVTHRTHSSAYRPILAQFDGKTKKEIPLPRIMWDDIDFVMFKGMHFFSDGTGWLAGQQGHLLFYDGTRWSEKSSPLIHSDKNNVYDGDLNDIFMTSKMTGWAVGKSGCIIRFNGDQWKRYYSPTDQTLQKISMVNDSTGWAVGNNGTIVECKNYQWRKVPFENREHLFSVFALNDHQVWIVGNNSTLISFDGKSWTVDESIKMYDDLFSDISIVKDSLGSVHVWVIGNQGIYTTSQSLGFSFTDITNQAGLRRTGKIGIFFNRGNNDHPDLVVSNDGGSSLIYENNGSGFFSDVTAKTDLPGSPRDAVTMAIGDVNNDGSMDVLQLIDHRNFKLYLGSTWGGFSDFTERSKLHFDEINSLSPNALKFIDLNNDGNLDLYVSNCDLPDQIFLGDGSGIFSAYRNETGIKKILNHASYGAVFGDFNNDGLPDIFIPYYIGAGEKFFSLFLNNGNMEFSEQEDSLFYSSVDLSPTAVSVADLNNDGIDDLFIHSQKIPSLVWINDGHGKFRDVSRESGFTEPNIHPEPINGIVGTGDVNNDGWLDVFDGSKLYLNSPGMKFTEVSERTGIQFVGTPAFADIDHDGDLDLFIGSSRNSLGKGDRAALFRNNLNGKNFIRIRVSGDLSNRSAIGAKVILKSSHGMLQSRTIGNGGNQLVPMNNGEVLFGAAANEVYSAKIIFPSGTIKEVSDIRSGWMLTFSETNVILGTGISLYRSILRTYSLLNPSNLVLRFFALIIAIFFFHCVGIRFGAQKQSRRVSSNCCVLLLFIALTHFSIYESEIVSTLISFFGTVGISVVGLFVGRSLIQKRDAQYISHYKIIQLLGAGGMGRVYKAIDSTTKQTVALKVLNPELMKDAENRRRLSAEGHLLSSFDHQNIVHVYEIGESNNRTYIAMEYLSGGTLRETLENNRPLSLTAVKQYMLQICDGVSEIHRKEIIHRDLKTGNVMIGIDGILRIMDFGLSKSPLVSTMTSLGTVLGTLGYVAPEQVTGLNVDRRTDIFSLGVMMYELITGELPFKGENEIALIHSIFNTIPVLPSTIRNGLSTDWDAIIMKCLSKEMHDRFASADEVKDCIIQISTGQ